MKPSLDPRNVLDRQFIDHLLRLDGWLDGKRQEKNVDRAALGALRRAAGKAPEDADSAHPHVGRYLRPQDFNGDAWQVVCLYVVGTLFALHPPDRWPSGDSAGWWDRNLGASFRRKALDGHGSREGVERRFQWLLASDRSELATRLRHGASLLSSPPHPVPIDWLQLLRDLRGWGAEGSQVQARWASAFWRDDQPGPTLAANGDEALDGDLADSADLASTDEGSQT